VIRWICNHPTAYVNLTGVLYTVPYGIIAWGYYIQGLALPLWVVLTLSVLYNVLCTWGRGRVSRPARRMDRENAVHQKLIQEEETLDRVISNYVQNGVHLNRQ
jgi:hypothetical protein